MSGKFEVAKFHGIDVAIFDSHWFANRIIETEGTRYMCCQIEYRVLDALHCEAHFVGVQSYIAAMQPYMDFMAVHKRSSIGGNYLGAVFTEYPRGEYYLRRETARRMLAAEPISYCIPLHITHK